VSGRLELRYQRLLWAYPRAYRNRRGTEIVTTLLEMAEARDARPSRGQALHLVLCGLRQRFRLPARRPLAWIGALLTAVILGAFGAAGGTWLGWQTAASVPSDRELRGLNVAMTSMPTPAAVYHNVSAMKGPSTAVLAEGTSDYAAERTRAALIAAGWRITSLHQRDGATLGTFTKDIGIPDVRLPTKFLNFTATKGDLKLAGDGSVITGGADHGLAGRTSYRTDVWPREPAAVRPITIVGLVLGALAGWWAAVAFAHRLRSSRRFRRGLATASCTVALAATVVPAYAHLRDTYQVMVYAHDSHFPYIVYSPSEEIPVATWTIIGLLAGVAALLTAWSRRTPATLTGPDRADGTAPSDLG
jgi:hypothetical protein